MITDNLTPSPGREPAHVARAHPDPRWRPCRLGWPLPPLCLAAQVVRDRTGLGVAVDRGRILLVGVRPVPDCHVADRWYGVQQSGHNRQRLAVGVDVSQDRYQDERDRLIEVQSTHGGLYDLVGLVQVSLDVISAAFRGAGEKGLRMDEDERVVVDVDNSAPT